MRIRTLCSRTICLAIITAMILVSVSASHASASPTELTRSRRPAFAPPESQIVTKDIREDSKTRNYSIDAHFPHLAGGAEARGGKFNVEVDALVGKRIAAFKSAAETDSASGKVRRSTITINYHVTFSNGRLLSVSFPVEYYLTRHGYETMCLTYDLQKEAEVTLADVFKPEADYLRVMAEFCLPRLSGHLGNKSDPNLVKQGASAKADNYKVWNLTSTGIEITFDPGRVAPAELGVQSVTVPFSTLKPLVATGSPVYALT